MRKTLVILIIMMSLLGFTKVTAVEPKIYGNVYLFDTNIPYLWDMLNQQVAEGLVIELNTNTSITKAVGLVNQGEIVKIFIAIPIKESYVTIKTEAKTYSISLQVYKIYEHFILLTFSQ